MGLTSLIKRAIPTAIGFASGGPVGAFTALSTADKQLRSAKKFKLQNEQALNEYEQAQRSLQMIDVLPTARPRNLTNQNAGFGSGFGNFLTEASTNILAPLGTFASGISSLFRGGERPPSTMLQPALTTVTNVGAQEDQRSGTNEAFIGGLPNIIGQASRFLRTPGS